MGQVVNCPDIVKRSKPCPSAYQGVDLSAIHDLAISFYYDIEVFSSHVMLNINVLEFLYLSPFPVFLLKIIFTFGLLLFQG